MSVVSKEELRDKIAKLFTDAHTPWPECTVLDWPDVFAQKVMDLFTEESLRVARELPQKSEQLCFKCGDVMFLYRGEFKCFCGTTQSLQPQGEAETNKVEKQ